MIHNDRVCFFLFCFALLLIVVGVVDLRHVGHALLKGLSNSSLPKLLGRFSGVIVDEDNELLFCPLLIDILLLSHCDRGWRCHIFSSNLLLAPRFIKIAMTAATGPLPIKRALKSDIVTLLVLYQQLYSNTTAIRTASSFSLIVM